MEIRPGPIDAPVSTGGALGVIVMAGGASRRMGEDKAAALWDGQRAIDRLAGLARALGAQALIVSGGDYGYPFVEDPSPQAGPVAGLLAVAAVLEGRGVRRALVLAVDAPTIESADLEPLLTAPPPGAHYAGLPLPLVVTVGALAREVAGDAPLMRLLDASGVVELPCPAEAYERLRGANTMEEREVLLSQHYLRPHQIIRRPRT